MSMLTRIALRARAESNRRLLKKSIWTESKQPVVSFSFDDFPRSAVASGAKILEALGVCGTFYVAGSLCGRTIEGIPQFEAEDVCRLAEAGHEIGCHTFSHRHVSRMTAETLSQEIERNAAFVDSQLPGYVLSTFAYPFGDMSLRSKHRLQHRFAACRSTDEGFNKEQVDLSYLRAIRLYEGRLEEGSIKSLVGKAVEHGAWLIFYTHDVDTAPTRFGCSPRLLEFAVTEALHAGAKVMPVKNAMGAVRFAGR